MKILVIGGGAAGYFTAINIKEKTPNARVTILEKSGKVLSKVRVSGGGRCNVTNSRHKPSELVRFYPRGQKKLHTLFKAFSTIDMVQWLEERGVALKSESDLRMFPVTDSSRTVIDCFEGQRKKLGIELLTNSGLQSIKQTGDSWLISTSNSEIEADKVVIATGSSPAVWKILENTGFEIVSPVPSLFTFNISDPRISGLQGLSFRDANVKVAGTKLEEQGPLLITHWGLSGPAILKLSAWGARILHQSNYQFQILINFIEGFNAEQARNHLRSYIKAHPKRKISAHPLFGIRRNFWTRITFCCGIDEEEIFGDLSKKKINKLAEELTQGLYEVSGKSTFKEEFVTSGGVRLSEINLATFESRRFAGMYLAGEVLDIDALTGGFNFQACWSAGWMISEDISKQ